MKIKEVGKVMDILTIVYPQFYAKQTEDEKAKTAIIWADLFADDPVQLVCAAVKAFIAQDETGYPPSIGQIKKELVALTASPDERRSEMEAWSLVSKATRNGYYGAKDEWEKLPEDIRKIVTPDQIRLWSTMDSAQFETVVQSNFMRSYKAARLDAKWERTLPNDLKQALPGTRVVALPD